MENVASDLISNIEGYQQLITTLSLGVAAGVFALLSQIIFHNAQNSHKISLSWTPLILVAVAFYLLAILFGVFTKSALVSSVSVLHGIEWGSEFATVYLRQAGLTHIMLCAMLQIGAFGVGTLLLFVVLVRNSYLLRPR